MHALIYAIVPASDTDQALVEARTVFDRLVGARAHACPVFDYYVTFEETDCSVAGPARWGDRPTAAPLDSEAGAELLDQGWSATKAEFQRHLDRVRTVIDEYDDDAIFRDVEGVRHAFNQLGAYRGPAISLYDEYADGIREPAHLERLQDDDVERWIVPADVHF
jgi:hypothetical protein